MIWSSGGLDRTLGVTLVAGAGLAAAVSIGWLASQGNPLLFVVSLIPAAAFAAFIIAPRPVWLLWCAVLGGLVIAGAFQLYIPQLQRVRWLLMPIATVLALQGLWEISGKRGTQDPQPTPSVLWWCLAFLAAVTITTASSPFVAERFSIAFKGYFQLWGLLIALTFIAWPAGTIDRLPRAFLGIALLQLPFVLHQLLVLVPRRVGMGGGIVPVDIVAGTFGASLEGGGANALLNAFLIIVIAGLLAARQYGVISLTRFFVFFVPVAIPIFVNSAKVSVLYLIAVFAVLYGKDLVERPLRFLAATFAMTLLLLVVLIALVLGAHNTERVGTVSDLIRFTYEYNIANDEVGDSLSRTGALEFWADRHGRADIKGTLIGHGIGYTRVADVETPYRETVRATVNGVPVNIDIAQNIGNTGVAALLWETGVFGLFCILGLFAATFRSAGRLEQRHRHVPERAAAFRAIRAAAVVMIIMLMHKNSIVYDAAYQTLIMIIIGFTAYWERQGDHQGAANGP